MLRAIGLPRSAACQSPCFPHHWFRGSMLPHVRFCEKVRDEMGGWSVSLQTVAEASRLLHSGSGRDARTTDCGETPQPRSDGEFTKRDACQYTRLGGLLADGLHAEALTPPLTPCAFQTARFMRFSTRRNAGAGRSFPRCAYRRPPLPEEPPPPNHRQTPG